MLPLWVKYVAAFGGIAASATAVAIATWGARRERRQRPRLELLYDHDHGEDFAVGLNDGSQHWVRLRVRNAPGRRSAEDVEVAIVEVDRDGERISRLTGFPFTWSNLRDETGEPATRRAIPPGVARRVDLLWLHRPSQTRPDAGGGVVSSLDPESSPKTRARLSINPYPTGDAHHLSAGNYRLTVVVTARDTDAAFYRIDVSFDGLWGNAATIRDHLKVSQPVRAKETAF